mmetsp:Transcript_142/g.463  ORF Transcript_142/g.463 Transcript_142/m.463 type:complete len:280 (-) Transcript_142:987-1826(-)
MLGSHAGRATWLKTAPARKSPWTSLRLPRRYVRSTCRRSTAAEDETQCSFAAGKSELPSDLAIRLCYILGPLACSSAARTGLQAEMKGRMPWVLLLVVAAHHALGSCLGAHALASRALPTSQCVPERLARHICEEICHLMDGIHDCVELAATGGVSRDVPTGHNLLQRYRPRSDGCVGPSLNCHVLVGSEAEAGVLVGVVMLHFHVGDARRLWNDAHEGRRRRAVGARLYLLAILQMLHFYADAKEVAGHRPASVHQEQVCLAHAGCLLERHRHASVDL